CPSDGVVLVLNGAIVVDGADESQARRRYVLDSAERIDERKVRRDPKVIYFVSADAARAVIVGLREIDGAEFEALRIADEIEIEILRAERRGRESHIQQGGMVVCRFRCINTVPASGCE